MPTKVLFVCLGNICRSPMAESLLVSKLGELSGSVHVESAGTGDWHVGQPPDRRTRSVLLANGIEHYSLCRQITASDFQRFDHIVAMDHQNQLDLLAWPGAVPEKVSTMMSWLEAPPTLEVPDPYHGTTRDFELVYELLDEATSEMLEKLQRNPGFNVK
ncbi:MAG: low molecular weight phosphotyrosine protein phosphatase [Fimbriimonas sp.]|nr:low molecular weight phosphotyrosine protein phosphatase [Fimbriimonas sp.]